MARNRSPRSASVGEAARVALVLEQEQELGKALRVVATVGLVGHEPEELVERSRSRVAGQPGPPGYWPSARHPRAYLGERPG